ncbi:MAG: hypothetical protein GPJ05_20110 [Microcystis aeruginosa G13-10]|nr:hypothetical protein [Microcystis aeruginosa G13-10]
MDGTDKHYVGDFDGDGRDDILIQRSNSIGMLTYDTTGHYLTSKTISNDWVGGWKLDGTDKNYVGDFNNDGTNDVLIQRSNSIGRTQQPHHPRHPPTTNQRPTNPNPTTN